MKFNWGTGIFLVIVVFMAACAAFFIFANRQDNTLVESDYYAKGLKYEEVLQKMRNTAGLSEMPVIQLGKDALTIKYPSEFRAGKVSGNVYLYRPSDKSFDQFITMAYDTALCQQIPAVILHKGKYVVKLDWRMGEKSYYYEKDIFVE